MSNPERSENSHKWLARFWVLNIIAVTVIYFVANPLWQKVSILYLALISLYANAATEYGNAKAAKAARVGEDNMVKKIARAFK